VCYQVEREVIAQRLKAIVRYVQYLESGGELPLEVDGDELVAS
jgi:hypothetical protein